MTPQMSRMMMALSLGFVGVILATHITYSAPQCSPRARAPETLVACLPATGVRA